MTRYAGRTVLVTGASRGLGAVLAEAFAAEGAWVGVGCRVRTEDAGDVLARVRAAGGDGEVLAFDLRDRAATRVAIEGLEQRRGGIDVLVANAAITGDGFFGMGGAEDWEDIVQVNLLGTAATVRAVTRGMLTRGRGAVLVVGSVAGLRAVPGQSAYATAKGGLVAFVRTLGAEMAPRGVRINAVIPGVLDAGMTHRTPRPIIDRWLAAIPAGRVGRAEEVARAALFLASDEASYIVGHALVVDGGLSL
ncbi:MAG: SDR family NAD(P)-dependent oxidoreductase [Pseudomonadota bacterium]|nr:SDR family NAD(P)-dependent oxidoreductase [Pseudomonadota bacterium]